MKEFMLLIRTEGYYLLELSPEEQQKHIQQVMMYMENLMKTGKLKSAQPLEQFAFCTRYQYPSRADLREFYQVMMYMENLMKTGKLKSAQPLEQEGVLISGTKGKLKDGPFNETKEVVAGYFLLEARDLDEAVQIARNNPVFESARNARIEVRPVKVMKGINS